MEYFLKSYCQIFYYFDYIILIVQKSDSSSISISYILSKYKIKVVNNVEFFVLRQESHHVTQTCLELESLLILYRAVKRIYFKVQSESINDIFALCYHFNELLQILKKVSCLPTHPPSGFFCLFICLFIFEKGSLHSPGCSGPMQTRWALNSQKSSCLYLSSN